MRNRRPSPNVGVTAVAMKETTAKKKPRRPSRFTRVIGGAWYAFVLAFMCLVGVVANMASRSSLVSAFVTNPFGVLNIDPREVFQDRDGFTLLILGTDETRQVVGWAKESNGQEHAISKPTGVARADMILVARLDFNRKVITGLSIPRDTYFELPDYDGKGHRINAYYSTAPKGEEKATMVRAVEYALPGVKIDRTIAIDYSAFQQLVDTVGGVSVVVPKGRADKGLQYDDWSGNLHVHLKPGPQVLDGKAAMGYVRFRHDSESDFGRQDRQKQFLASFKGSVFHHPFQLPEIAEQGKRTLGNALNDQEILALMAFARKLPPTGIRLGMLPTYPKGDVLKIVRSKRDDALREFNLLPESEKVVSN